MSSEANKAIVRRVFEEFFANHDLPLADELIAPDFIDHHPIPGQPAGPEGIKWVNTTLHSWHSDAQFIIDDLIAEGDKVAIRWRLRGTNTGAVFGQPPTGEPMEELIIAIFRVANGQIAERWAAFGR